MSVLYEAIRSGDIQSALLPIESGRASDEVNRINKEGYTPLGIAAELGNEQIVQALLNAGADANFGGIVSPLHEAVLNDHVQIVELLLRNNADINAPDEEGTTPLMMAVAGGRLELVEYLVDRGADVNRRNDYGDTVLDCAIAQNHQAVYTYLASLVEKSLLLDVQQRWVEELRKFC